MTSKPEKFLESFKSIFFDKYNDARSWIKWLFTFASLWGIYYINHVYFQFGLLGIVIIGIVWSSILFIKFVSISDFEALALLATIVLIVCSVLVVFSCADASKTQIEKLVPTDITRSSNYVFVEYGDKVLYSNNTRLYKTSNIYVCKTMKWNSWNVRLVDSYKICEE